MVGILVPVGVGIVAILVIAFIIFFVLPSNKGEKLHIEYYKVYKGELVRMYPNKNLFGYNKRVNSVLKFYLPKMINPYNTTIEGINSEDKIITNTPFGLVRILQTEEGIFVPLKTTVDYTNRLAHDSILDKDMISWAIEEEKQLAQRHQKKESLWSKYAPAVMMVGVALVCMIIMIVTINKSADMINEDRQDVEATKGILNNFVDQIRNPGGATPPQTPPSDTAQIPPTG